MSIYHRKRKVYKDVYCDIKILKYLKNGKRIILCSGMVYSPIVKMNEVGLCINNREILQKLNN